MRRFTISLADHQVAAIERIRRHRGVSRSRVVQQALALYLASPDVADELDDMYAAGYRAMPEDPADAESYARAAAEVLGAEEWS